MENHIYMPNEIFKDLKDNIESSKHIAFSYSYCYYITYLYRYCEWYKDKKITQADIKEKLQLSPLEKRVDYIIKKDGILDKIGYTETTSNYPIEWNFENGILDFRLIDDHNKEFGLTTIISDRQYKVKSPKKGFHRSADSERDKMLDGTFYEVESTHRISYDIFEKCMNNDKLGCSAFYIYAYLKWMNDMIPEGYVLSARDAQDILGISTSTFQRYTKELEDSNMLKVKRFKSPKERKLANVFIVK